MSAKRGTNTMRMTLDARRAIDPRLSWRIAVARPGRERDAARALIGSGVAVWLPHFLGVTFRRGRRVETSALFFPGYLFAGLDPVRHDLAAADVLWANPHIVDLLGEPQPVHVPAPVVQALADRLTGNVRSERLCVAAAFRVGEMRQVVQGPFASFLATVTELLATGRIKVDVSLFGRLVPVELDPQYLDTA